MNIQRFTAATSREAMAKARNAFGDSAVILSTRATGEGFEVMAAAEESLAPLSAATPRRRRSPPATAAAPTAFAAAAGHGRAHRHAGRSRSRWKATPKRWP